MEVYINATSCISHHDTTGESYFFEDAEDFPKASFLEIKAPDYKKYIAPNTLRRTSHILRMGISSGLICLERGGIVTPDAIITGTAMGCFEDTDKFLRAIIVNEERMLTPTPFIQSTHNTIAGQLALITQCAGYNFTYVHQNLSFESAVLDALMMSAEHPEKNILVGGTDELNDALKQLFLTTGRIRIKDFAPSWIASTGYVMGEGSAFLLLSGSKKKNSFAKITAIQTFPGKRTPTELKEALKDFLQNNSLSDEQPDLVLTGHCGDKSADANIEALVRELSAPPVYFKNLCGEYFTAGAFATWLAAEILRNQKLPSAAVAQPARSGPIRNILIINHYLDQNFSFTLLTSC